MNRTTCIFVSSSVL